MSWYTVIIWSLLIHGQVILSSNLYCPWSAKSMKVVPSCPPNEHDWNDAAKRKNCSLYANIQNCTTPEKFLYHCVINEFSNATVEVCAGMRFIVDGFCTEYNSGGARIQKHGYLKCTDFKNPCPTRYKSTEAFLYPKCYEFAKTTLKDMTENIPISKDLTTSMSNALDVYTTSAASSAFPVVPIVVTVSALIGAISFIVFVLHVRRRSRTTRHNSQTEDNNEQHEEGLSLLERTNSTTIKLSIKVGEKKFDIICELTNCQVSEYYCEWLLGDNVIGSSNTTNDYKPYSFKEEENRFILTVFEPNLEDRLKYAGRYRCLLKNTSTGEEIDSAQIDIFARINYKSSIDKEISTGLWNQGTFFSSFVTIERDISKLDLVWEREDGNKCFEVSETPNDKYKVQRLERGLKLIIKNITLHDVGPYRLVAKNAMERKCLKDEIYIVPLLTERDSMYDKVAVISRPFRENHKEEDLRHELQNLTNTQRCILSTLLCCEKIMDLKEGSKWALTFKEIQSTLFTEVSVPLEKALDSFERTESYNVFLTDDNGITFRSSNARYHAILGFTEDCYLRFHNLGFFIAKASHKTVLEFYALHISSEIEDTYPLIYRLQMDILATHLVDNGGLGDKIYNILNVPKTILDGDLEKRKQFLYDIKGKADKRSNASVVSSMLKDTNDFTSQCIPVCARSTIGLLKHNDLFICDGFSYAIRGRLDKVLDGAAKRAFAYTILLSDNYSVKLEDHCFHLKYRKIYKKFLKQESPDNENFIEIFQSLETYFVKGQNNLITFSSSDVQHEVAYCFVTNCLGCEKDIETYIEESSLDSLNEYARFWQHKRDGGDRCIFIPECLKEKFINKLGVSIILHPLFNELTNARRDGEKRARGFQMDLEKRFNIPAEIFGWKNEARKRYVQWVKKEPQEIQNSRVMIVGCAGAGKSTLLKLLKGEKLSSLRERTTTKALEIYKDLFKVTENNLEVLARNDSTENKKILSVFDFGGQSVYYACHQVYLSKRAFYILVIDMSRDFDDRVDSSICEQDGSCFAKWSIKDYIIFWLKSIHTYCSDDTPVILVGSHLDQVDEQVKSDFFKNVRELLPTGSNLENHLDEQRCFFVGLPHDDNAEVEYPSDIKECIASIANEERWRVVVPERWALSEALLTNARNRPKMLTQEEIFKRIKKVLKEDCTDDFNDMLQFSHDCGVIIHFDEDSLRNTAVIDIQWFVDAFKDIITDSTSVAQKDLDWEEFYSTGILSKRLLQKHWSKLGINEEQKQQLLTYMERLGLLAIMDNSYYVPSMNKLTFGNGERIEIERMKHKSSVLVFRFDFLPYFFYYRLIVALITKALWHPVKGELSETNFLYQNVSCFKESEHIIVLTVSNNAIQMQVFKSKKSIDISETISVRRTVENLLQKLTKTFHKKIDYHIGYQCEKQDVFSDDMEAYSKEEDLLENARVYSSKVLLQYWKSSC